jgi:hypothetical protein
MEPCLLPTTTRIQREIVVDNDTEQPPYQFTEKVNIKIIWGSTNFQGFIWSPLMGLEKFCHSTMMMLKRFCQLRNNLHITNNLEGPSECQDKFYKVRSLLDCINRRCQELEVKQHVAVDEQMIIFKGRHSCKQYISNKPSPWALKSFVLCGKSGQP